MGWGCHLSVQEVDKGGLVRWENLGRALGKEAELMKMPNQGSTQWTKDRLGTLRKTCSTCLFLLSPKSQPLSQLFWVIFVPVSWIGGIISESVKCRGTGPVS